MDRSDPPVFVLNDDCEMLSYGTFCVPQGSLLLINGKEDTCSGS